VSADAQGAVTPLSVVIATLGGDFLASTIAHLNAGDRPPAEILICIPEAEAARARALEGGNVRLVVTSVRGQVAQRAEGFKRVREPFVLQLDDDMWIDQRDIDLLMVELQRLGPGNAVAPVLRDKLNGRGIHRQHDGVRGVLQSLNATILGGVPWGAGRMGRVSAIGTNFGVDPERATSPVMLVDWVPGGCVLHYREGLVLAAFFPFPSKAYCEDLIHSHLLKARGTRLWVVRDAGCRCDGFVLPTDVRAMMNEARARWYFLRLTNAVGLRFWMWLAISILKRLAVSAWRRPSGAQASFVG
jgi:glycosyltransferase involved in cell wall biosynthesis